MNKEFFIAKRVYRNTGNGEKNVSPPAIRIAIASIALGVAVMIIAVAIIIGFKQEIRSKIVGFGSHVQVTAYQLNNTFEADPIVFSDSLQQSLRDNKQVTHLNVFATKPGIIKTDDHFQGIVLKGVGPDYDWTFFQDNLLEGEVLSLNSDSTTTDVLISKIIADKLHFKQGDSFITYFIQNENIRYRRYHIKGIYQTNFADYDQLFVICDMKQVQRLNQWDADMVSGLELLTSDFDKVDDIALDIFSSLSGTVDRNGKPYYVRSIKQINPMIFDWLSVLDLNVVMIIILMVLVSGFSMISGLLIIIIERANMIGILKALGENNNSIRKIFLYIAGFLIGKGLLFGNLLAAVIIIIQHQFGLFKLDPDVYYVSEVPMDISIFALLLINLGTFLATLFILVGPSYLIAKISPAKTIRFE